MPQSLFSLAMLVLSGALITSPAWAEEAADQGSNPHEEVVSPHAVENEAALAKLPRQELTPKLLYQFLLAEIAGARGNVNLSVGAYLDLARTTRDPRIAKRAAEIAMYSRQPDAALEAARIWVETDGEAPQARQMLAGLLLGAQRPEEAAVHLSKMLSLDNTADGLLRISRLIARFSDKTTALQLVDQLTAPYENRAEAQFTRAQAAVNAGEDARALAAIERAQALKPDWDQAVLFKAQLQQRNSSKQAMDTLRRFLVDHPKAREVRFAYARSLVGDKRYEEARREFATLLEESGNDPDALYALALLSMQVNDFVTAESHFKRLLEQGLGDPNPPHYYLGQITENTKRLDEAIQWYGKVTSGEQFLQSRLRIAILQAQQGRLEEGRATLQQTAVEKNSLSQSERVVLLIAEAQLLSDAGRNDAAMELLDNKLAAQPDQPELLYEAAMMAEKLGRPDILERNLRKLIQLKPDHAHAYNALGYSLADRGERLDDAQRLIEKALELAPDDPFILDSKGWLLYRRGDQKNASDFLAKALSIRADPEIAAHLGEVLWSMGRRDEALKTWNEAAKAYPANAALTATIKKFVP
ncbi:MAG: tetratricopeptide repeat protein [Proteobacteria bacterium]|nr:tetratricopeptide repeat protein [Pseudomonadota bacterium]